VDYGMPVTGGPIELGFDTSFCLTGSLDMAPYCFVQDDHTVGIPTVEKAPYYPQQRPGLMVPDWRDDLVDVRFTEQAVEFIDRQASRSPDRPFFLYLTPSAPHRPCVPPDFMQGRSQAGARGDMVAMVDWMVGQVDDALARGGLVEDTLFIVTSDNGARLTNYDSRDYGHKSCGDLRGQKADIWDGGHREPFIARWPGRVPAGTTSEEPLCLVDLLATCADILGVQLGRDVGPDSHSVLPSLLGQVPERPIREAIVHHSGDGMFSIRQGRWKVILGLGSGGFSEPRSANPEPGGPRGQLYDMESDLGERENLWSLYPEMVSSLTGLLDKYRQQGYSRPDWPSS
jgi:arylsulfatase A